jgi:FMN phosphatase YigB (HAD superfamily)
MPTSTTRSALLIDFGETLFLPLDPKRWLGAAARKAGISPTAAEHARLADLLDHGLRSQRQPGIDLSPAAHRAFLLPLLESLVSDKALAAALYDIQLTDDFWQPRDGARELLRHAGEQDLRVIVVSNVPWDIRPLFASAGLSDLVHGFVLSCEVGAEKPDKLIFDHALGIADCAPAQALFVGNDPINDSGALDAGIPVILVPPVTDEADRALFEIARWLGAPANEKPASPERSEHPQADMEDFSCTR